MQTLLVSKPAINLSFAPVLNIIFHRSKGKTPACQAGSPREPGCGERVLQSSASLLMVSRSLPRGARAINGHHRAGLPLSPLGKFPSPTNIPGNYGFTFLTCFKSVFYTLLAVACFSELQGTFKILMIISDIKNQPFELSFFVPGDLVSPISLLFPQADGEQLILLQQWQYFTFFCLFFSIINLPNAACRFIIKQLGKKACLLI